MKAVRLHEYHQQPVVEEVPEPTVKGPLDVVVKIGGAERIFDTVHDRHVEAAKVVRGDHTDSEGAAPQEALDQVVGTEVEPLRFPQHAGSRFIAETAAAVERL